VDTLNALAALLRFFGTAEIRFKILAFGAGQRAPVPVAMLNPSGAVVLLPWGGAPARNMRSGETAEDVAKEILARVVKEAA